jgi:hypothetical protein
MKRSQCTGEERNRRSRRNEEEEEEEERDPIPYDKESGEEDSEEEYSYNVTNKITFTKDGQTFVKIVKTTREEEEEESDAESSEEESQSLEIKYKPITIRDVEKDFLLRPTTTVSIQDAFMTICQFFTYGALYSKEWEKDVITDAEKKHLYVPCLVKIFDMINLCKESLVSSSVWSPELLSTLKQLTKFRGSIYEPDSHEKCQICRRSRHSPRYSFCLYGTWVSPKFYEHLTACNLEPYTKKDNVKPISRLAGQVCFKRLVTYHVMHHYKFYLIKKLRKVVSIFDTGDKQPQDVMKEIEDSKTFSYLYQGFNALISNANALIDNSWLSKNKKIDYQTILYQVFPIPSLFLDDSKVAESPEHKIEFSSSLLYHAPKKQRVVCESPEIEY